ncbi:MAG: glycosyltransferase family 4 protein [Bacteroidales bacterium]|nr:glycosyltransferase family 4 protein [Candidatus Latescibacterota bacterium]
MKVCFFSPTAYGYFNPDREKWAGGAETQQFFIARRMIENGISVSFITGDHGQPDVEIYDDIEVIKSFRPFTGNRKLRFIPDMLKVKRAMEIADADVFNQRSTSFYTGQLAWFAHRLGKMFSFSIGIDYNCYADCQGHLSFPMTALYRYGILSADAIIAQTEKQRLLLKNNLGIDSTLIRNGIPLGSDVSTPSPTPSSDYSTSGPISRRPDYLWVGSFRRRKRPELFLELARRMPEASFTIIGGGGDDQAFHEEIVREIATLENVVYPGFMKPGDIDAFYSRAYAYVNTSTLEGFPNTYLHSWKYGVPVLTIEIDPDSLIEDNGIGSCTGDFEGLVSSARRLLDNPEERSEMSLKAIDYVRKNHDISEKADQYIALFNNLTLRSE